MVVLIERVPPGGVPWIPAALAGADGEAPVAVVTALDGTVGARVLVGETGVSGSLGHAGLDAAAEELGRRVLAGETAESCDTGAGRLYGEPFDRPPALVIVGAGHVGKALASLGRFLGVEVTVVDDRPEYANRERFPEADRILAAPVREALARLPIGPRTGIIVAMRNHDLDYEATAAALDTRARFVGLLGARRKAAMAAERLAAAGVSPVRIRALRCPVGLDIGARTPEEIAVAIAGEWIMAREGGTGASLARPDGAGRKDARTAASA
jgi:xanthine dehydrogenase accessory factor